MSQRKTRILIVEDEPAHAQVLQRNLLASDTVTVELVISIAQYVEAISVLSPDIVLLDLNLPDGSAIELLNNVEIEWPVLIMTAQGNEELAVAALKAGALDYIVKSPESFAAIPRIVERSLREWNILQERQQAEEQAEGARREWETTFNAMSDVVTIHDRQMRIVRANKAAYQLTCALPGTLIGERCCEALWTESAVCVECSRAKAIRNGTPYSETVTHRRSGKVFEITTTPFPADSEEDYYIQIAKDVTTRIEYEKQLQHQATHDHLTGLANRMMLEDRLGQAIKQAQRSNRLVAILLLDLDRFKNVNDGYGHATGDELLCLVAARLKLAVRQTDTVARLGGDEFVVMLTNVADLETVQTITAAILKSLAKPYQIRGRNF